MYLLCDIFVDTAFLLCVADLFECLISDDTKVVIFCRYNIQCIFCDVVSDQNALKYHYNISLLKYSNIQWKECTTRVI